MDSHLVVTIRKDGSRSARPLKSLKAAQRVRQEALESETTDSVGIYVLLTEEKAAGTFKKASEAGRIVTFLRTALPQATDVKTKDGLVSFSVHGHRFHARTVADADNLVCKPR